MIGVFSPLLPVGAKSRFEFFFIEHDAAAVADDAFQFFLFDELIHTRWFEVEVPSHLLDFNFFSHSLVPLLAVAIAPCSLASLNYVPKPDIEGMWVKGCAQ